MSQNNIKIRVSVGKFYDDISKNKKKTKQTNKKTHSFSIHIFM